MSPTRQPQDPAALDPAGLDGTAPVPVHTVGAAVRDLLPGQQVDRHRHVRPQLVHAKTGVLAVATSERTWVVPSPSGGLWIAAGTPHAHRAHRAHGRTRIQTYLLPDPPADVVPEALRTGPVTVSPLAAAVLTRLTAPDAPAGERRDRLVAVLCDEILAGRGGGAPALMLPAVHDPRVAAVERALHADPADPRTLAAFGRAVGASERTLSRLVAAATGLSFPRWRTRIRLVAALASLTDGCTVTEAGAACGFASTSAFIAAFRQTLGTTPAGYRRTL